MTTTVARSTASSPTAGRSQATSSGKKTTSSSADPHPDAEPRHNALDDASRRWLAEGDTPENVASYARALRDLLTSA